MIGIRLKVERERLGATQPVFAEVAGAKKRTLIDWEKGVSSPTAVQLSALAGIGVDVMYVLTGQRATQRQAQIAQNMLLVSDDEKSQQLAQESIAALGQLNARRQQPYAYLVELLNDCSDNTLDMITQLAERLRLADVQKK